MTESAGQGACSSAGGPGRRVLLVSDDTRTTEEPQGIVARGRRRVETGRAWAEKTIFWQVWERMLETEFVDRSVALAGKAFVSFFPLVIVVAAFMPARTRASIFETLTTRLGVRGPSLDLAKTAFQSSDDVKKATGYLGLLLTFFFASAFTTALQRVYLRSWRRPPGMKVGSYTRGLIWLLALLANMTLTGALGRALGNGAGPRLFFVCLARGVRRLVVVLGLVPAARAGALAAAAAHGGHHLGGDDRLRHLGQHLDARDGDSGTRTSSASSASPSPSSRGSPGRRCASSSGPAPAR